MHPTAFRGTRSRGRAPFRVLIGRQLGPPLAEWLECVPKLSLRGSFVERRVDVGNNQDLNRCGEALELARLVLHGIRQRELDRVEELHDSLSHRDDELWLHDVQLTREERARLVLVAVGELDSVLPVDRHRIDMEPLERLEDRLAGAAVEGDPLLYLGRLRLEFEQHHVRERMAGSHDGHPGAAADLGHLVGQVVDLDDRLLEVLLVDLVGRWHGPLDFRGYRTRSLAWAIHLRDWRYTSDLGRRRIWAERRLSMNSSGPWKARIRTPPVPTPWSTCASEPAPIVRLYLRANRNASSL